jgi:hypothetical protein
MTDDKVLLAYIAGFLDGDGVINITRCWRRGRYEYNCRVVFHNRYKEQLLFIEEHLTSGCLHIGKKVSGRTPTVSFIITGKKCYQVLTSLLPYLRIRKPFAENVLEFISTLTNSTRGLTSNELEVRERLYKKHQDLYKVNPLGRKRKVLLDEHHTRRSTNTPE